MKLDHVDTINEYGDDLVRLYDFEPSQAKAFQELIRSISLGTTARLDLGEVDFITPVNCSLVLLVSEKDMGVSRVEGENFICLLTFAGYHRMVELIQPFVEGASGFQWLYDLSGDKTTTEFLLSPGGAW